MSQNLLKLCFSVHCHIYALKKLVSLEFKFLPVESRLPHTKLKCEFKTLNSVYNVFTNIISIVSNNVLSI